MARPLKWRRVELIHSNKYFAPCPKGKCDLWESPEIQLKIEELEALRLKDVVGLTQEECAAKMQVSRQTFQNIIDKARRKVTTALLENKAIVVGGGHYTRNVCSLRCLACGDESTLRYEEHRRECTHCGSQRLICNSESCETECDKH